MSAEELIQLTGLDSIKHLRKIIASKGQIQGNYYYAGNGSGVAGVVVTLTTRDPKGAKALSAGKKLRREIGGAKYSLGIVHFADRLYFEPVKGDAKEALMKRSFKNDFEDKELKMLKKFLRKVTFGTPENVLDEVSADASDEEINADDILGGLSEEEAAELEVLLGEQVTKLERADAEVRAQFESIESIIKAEDESTNSLFLKLATMGLSQASFNDPEVLEMRFALAELLQTGHNPFPNLGEPVSEQMNAVLQAAHAIGLDDLSAAWFRTSNPDGELAWSEISHGLVWLYDESTGNYYFEIADRSVLTAEWLAYYEPLSGKGNAKNHEAWIDAGFSVRDIGEGTAEDVANNDVAEGMVVTDETIAETVGVFSGDTLNLAGSSGLTFDGLLNLEQDLSSVKTLVLDDCSSLDVSAFQMLRLAGIFPNLEAVSARNCPSENNFKKKYDPEARARTIRQRNLADFSEVFNRAKLSSNPRILADAASDPLGWLEDTLKKAPVSAEDVETYVNMFGKLQGYAVRVQTTGVEVSEQNVALEKVVGEKFLSLMDDPTISAEAKQMVWDASRRIGHPLHNAALGSIEQDFESDDPALQAASRAAEATYTGQLKGMYTSNMERNSQELFGRPAEETVEMREDLEKFWESNAVLGRVWRSGEDVGPAAELHPSSFGLYMLAPYKASETKAIASGEPLASTGRPSPYKLHPEMDPSAEKGVEMFGGEGHTRDYYMRVSTENHGVMTFSTKGTGLDLTRPADADYYDGMLKHIHTSRAMAEVDEASGEAKLRSMLVQEGDDAHATVGFGDLSMAPKDFGNFGRKLKTAKELGPAYEPLTKALAAPVAVVSMPRTGGMQDLLPDDVFGRGELPTQIVTACAAETSRRLHRVGRKDQYRHKNTVTATHFSEVDWEVIYSKSGVKLRADAHVCTLLQMDSATHARCQELIASVEDLVGRMKALGDDDPTKVELDAQRQGCVDEWTGLMAARTERRVTAPEDGVFHLPSEDGRELPGQLNPGDAILSFDDIDAELREWDRVIDQIGVSPPDVYAQQALNSSDPEKVNQKTTVAYGLAYTLMGSMGVFLQEGDSTGAIGDSFEARNVNIAVRDADEWGKGQLRRQASGGKVTTFFAKDLGDLAQSLTCVLDSAGLAHNASEEQNAPQLVEDVQVLQGRIREVTEGLFGKSNPGGLLMFDRLDEDLMNGLGHRFAAELAKSDDESSPFWLAMKGSGVTMNAYHEVEERLAEAQAADKDPTRDKPDEGSFESALWEDPGFNTIYGNAKKEFKLLMIGAFKDFVAADLPEGLAGIGELFTSLDGDADYAAITKDR